MADVVKAVPDEFVNDASNSVPFKAFVAVRVSRFVVAPLIGVQVAPWSLEESHWAWPVVALARNVTFAVAIADWLAGLTVITGRGAGRAANAAD